MGERGGTDLAALGLGRGDVVIGELLRARGKMPGVSTAVDVWIAQSPDDASYPRRMLATATQLRADGLSVEYAFKAQRVDKQFEAARKAGARHIAILTDVSDGGAQVRVVDADRHEQHFDSIEAFARWASSTTGTTP